MKTYLNVLSDIENMLKEDECLNCIRPFMTGTVKPGKDYEFKFSLTSAPEYRHSIDDLPVASFEDLGQLMAEQRFPYSKMPVDGYPMDFCKTCGLMIPELT